MKLSISLKKFKKLHKTKFNQTIHISLKCKNYAFVENLYKFILVKKNSFIFESVEKGKIRGRDTIIGFNPDKIFNIRKNKIIEDDFNKKKVVKKDILRYLNDLLNNFKVKASNASKIICPLYWFPEKGLLPVWSGWPVFSAIPSVAKTFSA